MTIRRFAAFVFFTFLTMSVVSCGSGDQGEVDPAGAESAQLWTCGMHPQVVQEKPGTCPLCGMNLTPLKSTGSGSSNTTGEAPQGERKISHWVAPMDPGYISDKPGKSPMGMDLVPVYQDELNAGGNGMVSIDPVVVQNMGVRTQVVRRQTIFRHLRTIGEVKVAEDEVSVVNLRFNGWVERIFVDRTGDKVKAGQRLFQIYSPELVAAQEEYLMALRTQGPESPLARSARRKLDLWDINSRDIDAMVKSGEASRTLPIRAPSGGFVLHKSVVEGARVKAGEDLYRIGDLATIWVEAEVYEFDAPWVQEDQPAQMELSFQKGSVLQGKVSYIYPTLNPNSRTLRVRLEFENPGVALKPGMFATVRIQYRRRDDTLAIPTEAVILTGERELVFVALGQGRFTARDVTTGLVADHHMTEVLNGLKEGEVVVTSGQFLIDSESQLQEAVQKLLARRAGGEEQAQAAPTTLWSCPMHPQVIQGEPGRCPECGMFLEERRGTPGELATVYGASSAPGAHEGMDMGAGAAQDEQQGKDRAGAPGAHEGMDMGSSARKGLNPDETRGAVYTCPMHPEVTSHEPGKCPKCGMFLERVGGDQDRQQQ